MTPSIGTRALSDQISWSDVNRPALLGSCRGLPFWLKKFVWKSPHHGLGIIQLVRQFASALPPGSRVLDAGAGSTPYRELFDHCEYKTSDLTAHEGKIDYVCPITECPLPDQSFDAILFTEVLEHVQDPVLALKELRRLLVPQGYLCLSVPFMLGVHAEHDYFRFSKVCLKEVFSRSGLEVLQITPRFGLPMTFWGLLWALGIWLARADIFASPVRRWIGRLIGFGVLGLALASLLPFRLLDFCDKEQNFTVGYAVLARRPATV